MSRKNVLYILLVVVIAAGSALAGVLAGGVMVYRNLQQPSAALPGSLQGAIPAGDTRPQQMLTFNTTDIETAITQAVEQVGPAVVTVVGTLPGQMTIFGPTADQTVSGTGFFITEQGYIITNNHVVEGTREVSIILSDGSQERATIVGTDRYSDIAILKTDGKVPAIARLGTPMRSSLDNQ